MTKVEAKKINFYRKVLAVQEIYLAKKEEGITNKYVYEKHIKDRFFISIRTFYSYLPINAKRELRELLKEESTT